MLVGMGAWGTGLYADDLALDLRSTIGALCRLPKSGDELVDLLAELNPGLADDPDEGAVFWLVTADQLQRKGIDSRARQQALAVIADGTDLARLERLEMAPKDLAARAKVLDKLAATLAAPPTPRARRTLAKPQPHVVAPGEVYVFAVDKQGNPPNPYLSDARRLGFAPVGWSSCQVVGVGHALEYLAWCHVVASSSIVTDRPDLAGAVALLDPDRQGIGTLTRTRANRLGLELVGVVDDLPAVPAPDLRRRIRVTASDISITYVPSQHRWPEDPPAPEPPPAHGARPVGWGGSPRPGTAAVRSVTLAWQPKNPQREEQPDGDPHPVRWTTALLRRVRRPRWHAGDLQPRPVGLAPHPEPR